MVVFLLLLALPSCVTHRLLLPKDDGTWPMYGGDRARSNASGARISPPFEVAWEYDAGAGFGTSSPAVSGGTVIVGTLAGEVRAVDLGSGREIWSEDFGSAIFGTPLLVAGRMIVALSDDGENLLSYNTSKGSVDWRVVTADVESSPLHDEGRLFVAGLDGTLRCFDPASGRELWSFSATGRSGPDPVRSSPACDDSVVVFGSDGGTVYALDRETGRLVWKSPVGGAVFAPVVLGEGNRAFVSSRDGHVRALDLSDGRLLWSCDLGAPVYGGAALGGGRLYAGTTAGDLFALDTARGGILWRTKTKGAISAAPLLAGDYLYVGDLGRRVYGIHAGSGAIAWEHELPGRVKTTPVAAGEFLLVMSDDRSVVAFRNNR